MMTRLKKIKLEISPQYFLVILLGALGDASSLRSTADVPPHVTFVNVYLPFLASLPFVLLLLAAIIYSIIRMRKIKSRKKKSLKAVDLTREEAEALFKKTDYVDDVKSIERMSKEELRVLAERELEKQGLKPGDKDFFKKPLDWEDLDENFKPRPKIIRSDFSKPDVPKKTEQKEEDRLGNPTKENDENTHPPDSPNTK